MKKVLTLVILCTALLMGGGLFVTPSAHAAVQPHNSQQPGACTGNPTPWVQLGTPNGSVCILGSGYHGLGDPGGVGNQSNVDLLFAEGSGGWIRYYDSAGGHYCNFLAGDYFLNAVFVTQVDIGGTHSDAGSC